MPVLVKSFFIINYPLSILAHQHLPLLIVVE
jgi:hypothetical protein